MIGVITYRKKLILNMTFKEILDEATRYLKSHHIEEADCSAWQLMEFVWGINRSYYFTHSDDIIEDREKTQYMSLVRRRAEREPLQYITGKAYFMGYEFHVDESVLIPRFDTEILVDEVGKLVRPDDNILDMCSGSGCIAIALELEHTGLHITGVDISIKAIDVARRNARDLKANVSFVESDLFENVSGKYNIIVSNPPYIRTAVIDELMMEVQGHEPRLALDGTADGLHFYRRIISQAKNFLVPDGYLAFEIGYEQASEVSILMSEAGYHDIRVIKDLAGLDRVVIGHSNCGIAPQS